MTDEIKIGDKIKSFHFEPMDDRPNRFLIGEVTAVTLHTIIFNVEYDIVEGESIEVADGEATTAKPGKGFCDYEGRITALKSYK